MFIRIIVYLDDFLILGKTLEETILKQGYCGLPVTKSRFCHKPKEIISSPNTENRILGDNNRLSGDDDVSASGEGAVDFQKVSGYIVKAGVNKRPRKAFGSIFINSISNSSCTVVHEVPGGTKLVDIKPKTVKWEVSKVPPGQTFDTARCMKDRFGGFCQKTSIGGVWFQAEQHINILELNMNSLHKNMLELRTAKFAILTFCR